MQTNKAKVTVIIRYEGRETRFPAEEYTILPLPSWMMNNSDTLVSVGFDEGRCFDFISEKILANASGRLNCTLLFESENKSTKVLEGHVESYFPSSVSFLGQMSVITKKRAEREKIDARTEEFVKLKKEEEARKEYLRQNPDLIRFKHLDLED